jgi:hypothetical protein
VVDDGGLARSKMSETDGEYSEEGGIEIHVDAVVCWFADFWNPTGGEILVK